MSQFLPMSHAVVTEGHLHSHKHIFLKPLPENVPVMPISFLLHKYRLNCGLVQCLLNRIDWVDSSWWDSDQRESSRNLFDSNLELSRCDSNLRIFLPKMFNIEIIFSLSFFWKLCSL